MYRYLRGVNSLGERGGQKESKEGAKRVEKDYVVPVTKKKFPRLSHPSLVNLKKKTLRELVDGLAPGNGCKQPTDLNKPFFLDKLFPCRKLTIVNYFNCRMFTSRNRIL